MRYGEPILSEEKPKFKKVTREDKLKVKVLEVAHPLLVMSNGEHDRENMLLGPLVPQDVLIFQRVRMNHNAKNVLTSRSHWAV